MDNSEEAGPNCHGFHANDPWPIGCQVEVLVFNHGREDPFKGNECYSVVLGACFFAFSRV